MCLGVYGRGNRDETDWDEEQEEFGEEDEGNKSDPAEWASLADWEHEEVITTQCTNVGGVIEWLFVPFIVEVEAGSPTPANETGNTGGNSSHISAAIVDNYIASEEL
jgi:hypothetical protein